VRQSGKAAWTERIRSLACWRTFAPYRLQLQAGLAFAANQKPEPAHALEHDKSFLYHGLDASFRGAVTRLEGQVASANRLISA
jgi:hypothetical protein